MELQAFGMRFFGLVETVTNDIRWFEDDGDRIPLLPLEPQLMEEGRDGL